MKEKPILFSGQMVNAILAGRKTQTRRVLKDSVLTKPPYFFSGETRTSLGYPASEGFFWAGFRHNPDWRNVAHPDMLGSAAYVKCPYGQPGDRLWVKETFAPSVDRENHKHAKAGYTYRADWSADDDRDIRDFQWKPSIFCTRAASRITLEITDVRAERLQCISVEDALAEGIEHRTMNCPRVEYQWLWESINGPGSWAINPFVWVIGFKPITS